MNTQNHKARPILVTNLTARGNNQAGATPLLANANHEFTTVSIGSGAILPFPMLPSGSLTIYNAGSNALLIYPSQGGTINGGALNAPASLAAGSVVSYWPSSLTNYYASLSALTLPTTGLTITQHAGVTMTDTDAATITFDLSIADWHQVTLGGNRTLAIANPTIGQQFTIELIQDATGGRTVTWFSGIKWPGGTLPMLTTAASKTDVFTFKCVGAGSYLGFPAGQNF